MQEEMTHHPDCLFWPDNENDACCCGLTGPAIGTLRPWTKQAMEEWRRKVTNVPSLGKKLPGRPTGDDRIRIGCYGWPPGNPSGCWCGYHIVEGYGCCPQCMVWDEHIRGARSPQQRSDP